MWYIIVEARRQHATLLLPMADVVHQHVRHHPRRWLPVMHAVVNVKRPLPRHGHPINLRSKRNAPQLGSHFHPGIFYTVNSIKVLYIILYILLYNHIDYLLLKSTRGCSLSTFDLEWCSTHQHPSATRPPPNVHAACNARAAPERVL